MVGTSHGRRVPSSAGLITGYLLMNGFKICRIATAAGPVPACSRRDFYTVWLLTGPRQLHCADQKIELDETSLCFGKAPGPGGIPQARLARQTGYSCRFTAAFFKQSGLVVSKEQWSLVNSHELRAFALGTKQAVYLNSLF